MGEISRALAFERTGDYRSAVRSLMGVLDDIEASSEWETVCEWIASSFENHGENAEAGLWYEAAAQISLVSDSSSIPRISEALHFVQKASCCYSRSGHAGEIATKRTKAISAVLERICPPV